MHEDANGTSVKGKPGGGSSGFSAGQPRPFSARFHQDRSGGVMSLNLTPMIDIVFLLLFFFLTVSRFRAAEGMLPAHLPTRAAGVSTDVPRTPIRIRFVADANSSDTCLVTIDRFKESPLPISELTAALGAIRNPQQGYDARTPVHLLAGDDVAWEHVVNAYNAAMAAQYERIFFAGSP